MDKAIETKDMAVTPHIKLKLPSQNDYYDVDVDNENAGIIDTEIEKLQNKVNDANNNADGRVKKTGDTMTGVLTVNAELFAIGVYNSRIASPNKQMINSDTESVYVGNPTLKRVVLEGSTADSYKTSHGTIYHEGNFNPNDKTSKGGYNGTAEDLKSEIDDKLDKGGYVGTAEEIYNSSVKYPNFKGEYDSNKTYIKDDIVFMDGHEIGYVHEIIDGGYPDPARYKETRRDYRISDRMYYKYDGADWEMLLTELDEVSLNLYTVAHKPADQNYESTWDNFFPYSEIGRWLVHKDTCEEIAKMDKIYGDRREGASSAVANDWNGTNGDIAVKIPRLYVNYKHTSRGKRIRFYSYKNPAKKISLEAYVHPAFVTDFEAEAIYMGATKGRNINGQLRACEGGLQVSQNIGWFLTASRANRTTDYCITPFSLSCLLQDLFLMEFGSVHSQEILGQGRSNTTSASSAGTTKTLGDRSGRVSTDNNNGNVSYRGIEDCFGNIWEFGVGIIVDDNGYYHTNKLSAFNDKSKMDKLPISTILLNLDDQRIKSYAKMDSKSTNHLNIPVEIGASDSTYYTDGFWCHDKGEENIAMLFGRWDYAGACGLRTLDLSNVASSVSSNLGARFTFFKK